MRNSRKARKERNRRHVAVWGNVVAVLASVVLVTGLVYPQDLASRQNDRPDFVLAQKLSPGLAALAERVSAVPTEDKVVRVIVQFKNRPTAEHFQKVVDRGGKMHANLGFIRGGAFSMRASELKRLAEDDSVAMISVDHPVFAADDLTDARRTRRTRTSGWRASRGS